MTSEVIPNVFVGTMYCGEGGFKECCSAILTQKGVTVHHHVIANQPEKEAHNKLWAAWRAAQGDFDFFVKVDADTVLAHDSVLIEFWNMMKANPRITGIQAPLIDYFTQIHINGLNCFSPKVTFQDTTNELFCDRQVDVDHDIVIKSKDVTSKLRPAGYHAFNPTDIQSFHFGLHRSLKKQDDIIKLVKEAYHRNKDRPRAFVLLGAQCASTFSNGNFNYENDRFKVAFEGIASKYDELVKNL